MRRSGLRPGGDDPGAVSGKQGGGTRYHKGMPPSASHSPRPQRPLYSPQRDYPRPAAKEWIARVSGKFSLERPINHGEPWLPLTAIEGIIVLGHKDASTPPGDIPEPLSIRVQLSAKDYARLRDRGIEHLTSFGNTALPSLSPTWERFRSQNSALPAHLQALQFLITHGLATRPAATAKAADYWNTHKECHWLFRALANGSAILPVEDLHPNRLPTGKMPDYIVTKYHAVCYEAGLDELHIVVPADTNIAGFKTDLRARLEQTGTLPALHIALGDRAGLEQFLDATHVERSSQRDAGPIEESTDETGELNLGDVKALLSMQLGNLSDARDVLRWALAHALSSGATDIHLDPIDASSAAIRLRLSSGLKTIGRLNTNQLDRVITILKIRCNPSLDVTEKRIPQDGKFRVRGGERDADVRVNTLPVMKGEIHESAALRILGRIRIPSIRDLGISSYQIGQLEWVLKRDHGLFLVTGPTGSGKTTTLNTCLKEIAGEDINVMSVEAPVELPLPWVKQVQIDTSDGAVLTFESATRAFLRHDPDVIMVGEVRDAETLKVTLSAAQTGHLVFGTLHTNSALMTFPRLVDLGGDRSVIGQSVLGVQAQQLIGCLCPQCRDLRPASKEQRVFVERFAARIQKMLGEERICPEADALIAHANTWLADSKVYHPSGCSACKSTGFHRKRAVMEIYLVGNDAEAVDMILEGKPHAMLQRHFAKQGFLDLSGQMLMQFLRGETSYEEIERFMPLI